MEVPLRPPFCFISHLLDFSQLLKYTHTAFSAPNTLNSIAPGSIDEGLSYCQNPKRSYFVHVL